jgi:hypothetical protein
VAPFVVALVVGIIPGNINLSNIIYILFKVT